MAELKNLDSLAQQVANAAATARTADINAAKIAVIETVKNEVVEEAVKDAIGVDLDGIATKAEVTSASTAASTALSNAVNTLNGTIAENKTAAEAALSNYSSDVTELFEGVNTSIGENATKIATNTSDIATNKADIITANGKISANEIAIAAANDQIALKANASDVYTKQEVNELLGNEAGVDKIIGTYTKEKIDELLAAEMDVVNTYSQAQADAKFATITDHTSTISRVTTLETKCATVLEDIQTNASTAANALQAATDANTVATGAKTTAESALSKVVEAKQGADSAVATAQSAETIANGAKADAATAVETANAASSKADQASTDAANAIESAGDAETAASKVASDLSDYQTSNDAALALKASKTELSDKAFELQTNIDTKVSTETYTSGLATKVDKTTYAEDIVKKLDITTFEQHVAESYNKSQLYTKTEVYTKAEVTGILGDYATTTNLSNLQTTVTDGLALKLDKVDYEYDQSVISNRLDTFAVAETTNAAIALKADSSSVYTKSEVQGLIEPLAVKATVEAALDTKANASDVYTKDEVDAAINSAIAAVLETIQAQLSGE